MKKFILLLALVGIGLFINAPVSQAMSFDAGYNIMLPQGNHIMPAAEAVAFLNFELKATQIYFLHPDPGEAVLPAERASVLPAPLSGYLNYSKIRFDASSYQGLWPALVCPVYHAVFSTSNGGSGY